jgi:hypothetical protein
MPRIVSVHPIDDYRLSVSFDDGTQGMVLLRDRLFGPVFEPLQDPAKFRQVFVDEFGAIAWPNGADLAPDALYEQLRGSAEVATRS